MHFRFFLSKYLSIPIYFLLLPVFFVLHGLMENLFVINFTDALLLMLRYVVIEVIFYLLFIFIYGNKLKASFAVFVTFFFYYFFGAFHDSLKLFIQGFFSSYSFLLCFLIIFFLLVLIYLFKKAISWKISFYLNTLFTLLISLDIVLIALQFVHHKSNDFIIADNSQMLKPNIYLIVVDGYAGSSQLKTSFNFLNDNFLNELSTLKFAIIENSRSNYTSTPFSMASLLSMSYHKELNNFQYTDKNLNYCYNKISNSEVVSGLESLGYMFLNNSIFDFKGKNSIIDKTFLKSGSDLITSQTLFSRIKRDLYENFIFQHMRKSWLYKDLLMKDYYNNELVYNRTIEQVSETLSKPKFVYTHLLMPHFPYYFNSRGKLNSMDKLSPENLNNKYLYLEYLKYVNDKLLTLISKIISTDKQSIILLISDHGYRYSNDGNLIFSNLFAIYDNQHHFVKLDPDLTNVNAFRILFNSLFQTNLKILPNHYFK